MEAASGFEPLDKGFAGLCLTTWLRRPKVALYPIKRHAHESTAFFYHGFGPARGGSDKVRKRGFV